MLNREMGAPIAFLLKAEYGTDAMEWRGGAQVSVLLWREGGEQELRSRADQILFHFGKGFGEVAQGATARPIEGAFTNVEAAHDIAT